MRNIRLVVEYDGTGYAGWQVQPGFPTVQGEITKAVKEFTGAEVRLFGASRTDSGVHALGQTANFFTDTVIPVPGILDGLNSKLPGDIVIREALEADPGFDSKKDSKGKTYVYKVLNRKVPSALLGRYSWFVNQPLDLALMEEGARQLIGLKDFSSFRAAGSDARGSMREVFSFRVKANGGGFIEFEVKGNAFLRHMVRIMIGTVVTLGLGGLGPADIERIIEARDRAAAPRTAPAHGLCLMKVEY
jgi:tRNA pseudouridine38-40 synthase